MIQFAFDLFGYFSNFKFPLQGTHVVLRDLLSNSELIPNFLAQSIDKVLGGLEHVFYNCFICKVIETYLDYLSTNSKYKSNFNKLSLDYYYPMNK